MPVTLDTALNQDQIAFVEIIDKLHTDLFVDERRSFEIRDVFPHSSGGEVIYGSDFWYKVKLSVYAEDSSRGSVVLIIDGSRNLHGMKVYSGQDDSRYINAMMFYSGKVDSMYLKTCRVMPSQNGDVSVDIEIYNAYWQDRIAHRVKSNDTILFDDNFNLKARPCYGRAFIPDEKTRNKLGNFVRPLIERSEEIIRVNKNFLPPNSQGKRNR